MRSHRVVLSAVVGGLLLAWPARAGLSLHPGIEAGWQSSNLLYDRPLDIWNTGWANTFTGGVTLDLPIAHGLGLGTGVRYVCYSNRVTFADASFPPEAGQFRLRANYVAVPLLVSFAPRRQIGPRLALGPELAFLTSARVVGDDVVGGPDPLAGRHAIFDDIRSNLEPVDLSLCATLGWAVPLESHAAIAQLRFTRGLTDAERREDWGVRWKTVGVDGTLGLRW